MKRVGDLLIACALLVITLPVMAVVALAIKVDSAGPVLTRRNTIRAGRRVMLFEFRATPYQPLGGGPMWSDNCLTRVGWFLRHARIEHLPQLLNVLRGELTLTGIAQDRPDFWRW